MDKVFVLTALAALLLAAGCLQEKQWEATPSPTPLASPSPSPSPTPLASPSPSPSPLPVASPSPSPTPSPVAPNCTISASPNLFTGPGESVLSAVFYNLPSGVTSALLKCTADDVGANASISATTRTAFRTCTYSMSAFSVTHTISASADSVSCTNSLTVLGNPAAPPVISGISASAGVNNATISWTTDRATDGKVEYGLNTSYGYNASSPFVSATGHQVLLTGLSASTTYRYRVWACVSGGPCAVSNDYSFTTSAPLLAPTWSFNVSPTSFTATLNASNNETTTQSITLNNTGNQPLSGIGCAVNASWVTATTCPATLAVNSTANAAFLLNSTGVAAGSYTILITFTATNATAKTTTGVVSINS